MNTVTLNSDDFFSFLSVSSDLQLLGELHMVVIDEDVSNEVLSINREGGRSNHDVWLNYHLQQSVGTPGPIPHLKRHKKMTGDEIQSQGQDTQVFSVLPNMAEAKRLRKLKRVETGPSKKLLKLLTFSCWSELCDINELLAVGLVSNISLVSMSCVVALA